MPIYDRKFVPLISDAGFKAVFACRSNKELLIGLLNHLLPDGVVISDIIEYCDREQQQDTVNSKRGVLDLICRDKDGSRFIVEVQGKRYPDFFKRIVYYASGVYHLQLTAGADYKELCPVYAVNILNHRLCHKDESLWDTDHIVSHYEFMETGTGEFANQTISITFAELERFTKSLEECKSDLDFLFYWFIHCQSMEEAPDAISAEQKLKFETDMINELDRKYEIAMSKAEGRAEGLAEGEAKRNLELAAAMKAENLSTMQIAKITGLSESEIEKL